MRLPSGRTIGLLGASSSSEPEGRGSGARSPSAATSSSCRKAAVIALMRGLLSVEIELGGAEHACGDAELGRGPGVAGRVLVGGDVAGDLPELGRNRRVRSGDALVGVEDLVMLAAARGQERDDVRHAGVADV